MCVCTYTERSKQWKNAKGALTQQCTQRELLSVTLHLPPVSLHPRGYFASQEETGSSSMQMTEARREAATPSLSWPSYINEQKKYGWKKKSQRASHYWAPPVVCAVFAKLDRTVGCRGWVLARSYFSCALPLFLSPSLNWGQGPLGPALLCRRKIANPGYSDWTVKAGVL